MPWLIFLSTWLAVSLVLGLVVGAVLRATSANVAEEMQAYLRSLERRRRLRSALAPLFFVAVAALLLAGSGVQHDEGVQASDSRVRPGRADAEVGREPTVRAPQRRRSVEPAGDRHPAEIGGGAAPIPTGPSDDDAGQHRDVAVAVRPEMGPLEPIVHGALDAVRTLFVSAGAINLEDEQVEQRARLP